MTVHVITPAGDLAGTSTPVQFSLDLNAISVSLEYLDESPKRWDMVFGDTDANGLNGRFSDAFASSEKSGNLFTIRPPGATWGEGRFQLVVDEGAGSPDTLWDVLYTCDLRDLPSQAIVGDSNVYQNFTLDGQPWYVHTSSGSLALVNGQGLVGNVSGDASSGNQYAGIHFGLKLYQMAGWDPAKETAVQVVWGGLLSDLGTSGGCVGASHWTGGEAWGYGPGNNAIITRIYNGPTVTWSHMNYTVASVVNMTFKPSGGESIANVAAAVSQMPFDASSPANSSGNRNFRSGLFKRETPGSGFPPMERLIGLGAWNGTGNAESNTPKMGFYAGQPSGSRAFQAIKIRALQRAIPA